MTRKLRPGAYPAKVEAGDENPAAALLAGVRAVLFDLDGTLVDSTYDWPAIRAQLGVTGASIIDQLNGLPEPERGSRWAELEAIEARATDSATLQPGTHELLGLLAENGLATALVTNNNQANTRRLLDRFGLDFDLVLTRDAGLWKPSGAPFAEAARRLGLPPGECL
jgi:HAD superfamily hydrolase (TIGR01509 family)